MKRELEEKDSLDESDDEDEPDYGDDEEDVPEEEEERPAAVVLRENPSRHHEGWYQDDWQGDDDRREYDQTEGERYEPRGYDREWSYGKGKGKRKNKGKSKSRSKGKDKYPRRWYEASRISEENLIKSLIKKGERHQAEWIESLPRNKVTWDKLVAGGEGTGEPEFEIAIRLCVKKAPRHTGFAISPDCRYTKKFSIQLKSVDDHWEIHEKAADPYDQEEFSDEEKPLLFLACLIPESSLETQRSESRVREYDSLGDVVEGNRNLNAFYANTCNDGLCRMALEDDLLTSFTGANNIGKPAERYTALAAAAGRGDLTGRKSKSWNKNSMSKLGLLLCLGCCMPVTPAGHEVLDDSMNFNKVMRKLDAEYYPQATVLVGGEADMEKVNEVVLTLSTKGGRMTVVTPQFGFNDTVIRTVGLEAWHGPGDINLYGEIEMLREWASRKDRYHAPMSSADALTDAGFQLALEDQLNNQTCIEYAFPAEDEAERIEEIGTLDMPEEVEDQVERPIEREARPHEVETMFDQEGEMLDEIPLPNLPRSEHERREQWLKLPRATRIAVRKLHRQFGHIPNRVLIQILRASNAKADFIQAARTLRCEGCDAVHPKPQTQKVALPRSLSFNDSVGVDIFEVKDANGERYSVFSMVDQGTCFHQATVVKVGGSQATSRECLKIFQSSWMSWAGPPREVVSDRGLHNRGEFSKEMASMGCQVTQIGVESPEQLGRTERHGGLLKAMIVRVVAELQLTGKEAIQHTITQSVMTKNSLSRVRGFAPAQWVLGRLPREAASIMDEENWADLGSLTAAEDSSTEFGRIAKIREKARKAFIRADMSSRVRRAILRKSAPIPKEYGVGDLVCFRTDQLGWSTVSRIIGFDGPKVVWVLCKGTPACVALDRLRPVNASEALAHQFLRGQKPFVFGSSQQGYMDMNRDLPTVPEGEEAEEDSGSDGAYEPSVAPAQDPRDPADDINLFSDEEEEPSRETTAEPEMEHIPSSRRRSAESTLEAPMTTRRRIMSGGQTPTESRATESRAAERTVEEVSPLTETWRRTGTTGTGVEMASRGYEQTNLAAENLDEWHYDEKMGVLIREHKTPRIALFCPQDVADCPVSKDILTKGRITEVEFNEGKSTVMQDSWENDYGIKMLNREWTGKTIFLARGKPREEKPKLDEKVQAFIAARFDAVVSKNSKKKERGKVFDFDRCDEETKNGIIGSRTTEWLKWKKFLAAQIVAGGELQELRKDGHKPVSANAVDRRWQERAPEARRKASWDFAQIQISRKRRFGTVTWRDPNGFTDGRNWGVNHHFGMDGEFFAKDPINRRNERILPWWEDGPIDVTQTPEGRITGWWNPGRCDDAGKGADLRHKGCRKKILVEIERNDHEHWIDAEFTVSSAVHVQRRWWCKIDDGHTRGWYFVCLQTRIWEFCEKAAGSVSSWRFKSLWRKLPILRERDFPRRWREHHRHMQIDGRKDRADFLQNRSSEDRNGQRRWKVTTEVSCRIVSVGSETGETWFILPSE